MRNVLPGDTLTVLATDPVATIDFPYYCYHAGLEPRIDDKAGGGSDLRDPQARQTGAAGTEPPDRMTTETDSGSSRQTPLARSHRSEATATLLRRRFRIPWTPDYHSRA